MSASGQWPASTCGAQAARIWNCPERLCGKCSDGFLLFQSSQKSSEMRHICAHLRASSALATGVGPGERLKAIGLPVFLSASLIMRISSSLYGDEMQSTLMKSSPQPAYILASES